MRPILFHIGPLVFHSYAVAVALAFLTGVLLSIRENYKRKEPFPITPNIGIWIFLGALIGARAYYILQYDAISHLYRALFFWQGGLVFYGGLLGGVFAAIIYLRMHHTPILIAGDIAMPNLALAHAIGRVGCFLNGCCWGAPTTLPWGVSYPRSDYGAYAQQLRGGLIQSDAATSLPCHPAVLYSSVGLICISFVLRWVYRHKRHDGQVFLLYPVLYGFLRFSTEFTRGDSSRPWFQMTASQCFALSVALLALLLYCILRMTAWRNSPTTELAETSGDS